MLKVGMMSHNDFKNKDVNEILDVLKTNPGNSVVFVNDKANNNAEGKYIVLKDIHANCFFNTTDASKILENYQSPYNATIVENLINDGYTIVGSSNLDEFAMGSATLTSCYGPVDNQLSTEFVSGGSSGGSAYLVAKDIVPFATATDTGGSIRQPSAFNGVYGLKPTYGLVSRYGTFSFASSFDTIGPITKTLEDNMLLLETLMGNDEKDQTNFVPSDFSLTKTFNDSIKGMNIGIMRSWIDNIINPEIKEQTLLVIDTLKKLGANIIDINIPNTNLAASIYIAIAYAEGSSNLNRYDGMRYGNSLNDYSKTRSNLFGTEVKRRITIGTYMLNENYGRDLYDKALAIRGQMANDVKNVFNHVDCLIGPITPELAFEKNKKLSKEEGRLFDEYAIVANLVGIPAMSVPIATAIDGRNIAIQIMANHYQEHIIYQVANNLLKELNV